MAEIQLTQGRVALIDDSDVDIVAARRWCYHHTGYALSSQTHGKQLRMHRYILQAPETHLVDHVNGDRLDNRRSNLRLATFAGNSRNRKPSKNNTTGFKGVVRRVDSYKGQAYAPRYTASISVNDRFVYVGSYGTPLEAALAYDAAAIAAFGEFALTNAKLGLLPTDREACHR